MFRTTAALGLLAASFGASDVAHAQYYPPYYRAPPPYYAGPPPAEWNIDDLPVGSIPGDVDPPRGPATSPRANAAPDPYYRPPPPYGAAPSLLWVYDRDQSSPGLDRDAGLGIGG